MNLKGKILDFLYKQAEDNKIPYIKKGMVEDLEQFVTGILADVDAQKSADRMKAASEDKPNE